MLKYDDITLINLIKSARQRENDKAFKHLYEEYFSVIQKVVYANSGDGQDAEDIFQDGLIVLYHQIKKDKLDLTCSLKTYLYSICRNLWLKKLRRSSKIVELSDTLQQYVSIEESHIKVLEENEQKKIIADYLDQLNEGCRKILLYFYFEKIKMSEIAELTGLGSEQAAKNKKSGCMKKLSALMKNSHYFK